MKILEIKRFTKWAQQYEGSHEVTRWAIGMSHREGGWRRISALEEWKSGLQLLSSIREGQFDLVVCGSFGLGYGGKKNTFSKRLSHRCKGWYERALISLVCRVVKKSGAPLAVVDFGDDLSIHPVNVPLLEKAALYFKRELPLDPFHFFESLRSPSGRASAYFDRHRESWRRWVKKLKPLSLGCCEVEPLDVPLVKMEDRAWDLFYSGGEESRPRREGIMNAARELESRGYKVYLPEKPLDIEDYLKALSQSRLALSPPGLGWDCHRHYEAALVGSVPVTPFPTIQRHQPLINGEHCLFYDPEKNLTDQLEEFLQDRPHLERVARASREFVMANHLHAQLFDHVISTSLKDSASKGLAPA